MVKTEELERFFERFPVGEALLCEFGKKIGLDGIPPSAVYEILRAFGMPIEHSGTEFALTTARTHVEDAVFCFVDIETNGSNPKNSQIIEIGAVKYKNGVFLESFEELIFSENIPQNISEITGIWTKDLVGARSEGSVLADFRLFLGDAIFCAHSVDFDFGFISKSFQKHSLGPMLNRKLCTFNFAKKTLAATKYGLKTLKEELGIGDPVHHRALPDAKSSALVFKAALESVNIEPPFVDNLIKFINSKPEKQRLEEVSEDV